MVIQEEDMRGVADSGDYFSPEYARHGHASSLNGGSVIHRLPYTSSDWIHPRRLVEQPLFEQGAQVLRRFSVSGMSLDGRVILHFEDVFNWIKMRRLAWSAVFLEQDNATIDTVTCDPPYFFYIVDEGAYDADGGYFGSREEAIGLITYEFYRLTNAEK